ncbi:hypothetical protein A2U01_0026699, partial [Trifolium medium]|nr:hypothetical protein [Trifolium medium]
MPMISKCNDIKVMSPFRSTYQQSHRHPLGPEQVCNFAAKREWNKEAKGICRYQLETRATRDSDLLSEL